MLKKDASSSIEQKEGRLTQIEYMVIRITALISLVATATGIIYHKLHPLWVVRNFLEEKYGFLV